ncbi:MAG: hypothetical protein K2J15_06945 [Muribaculaceae bacterium]|nr:hypothetical protein [Muribaculaceae bacterium]
MKTLQYMACGLGLLALGTLASCQDSYDQPELVIPVATLEPTITIADFKEAFADELAVKVPLMDQEAGIPYVIHGRVISSDASGNIYKSLVIQDETAAIALSVNQGSMYIDYRLGQEVVINATDLWIGMYNNYIQLGMLGEYNNMPQITFMSYDTFQEHTELSGLPDQDFKYIKYGNTHPADNPYCLIFSSFSEIPATGTPYVNVMSQLVEFPNVSFVDAGPDMSKDPDAEGNYPPVTFAPYQDNADRYIRDVNGQTLNVRCSGYSSFYNDPLPEGTGTVRGILSRYGDSWQLLLRGTEDLLFDDAGSRESPYTVAEAIGMNNNGRTGWVEGYIIGSVKSGVQAVTSTDDIIFSGAAEMDNNLVIASAADCRKIEEMMIVELPAGSRLREWGNLIDHPEVLGKKLYVKGSMNQWLGMHGVTDVGEDYPDFSIEGQIIPGITGQGSGTSDAPFTVTYLKNIGDVAMTNVYIEGYIVGWINGADYNAGAHFGAYVRGGDYANNNLILAPTADYVDPADTDAAKENSIPVELYNVDLRNEYGLMKNPDVLGKKVRILCNVSSTIYGEWGITNVQTIDELP